MVRSGASMFAYAAVALLSFALLPAAADEPLSHGGFRLDRPSIGTEIRIEVAPGYNHSVEYTFTREGKVLAGHYEHRAAAFAEMTEYYDHWNHTFQRAYDLKTGFTLGHGDRYEASHGWPLGDELGPLESRHESDHMFGSGPHPDSILPESLLWGRSFWPGESWTVPMLRSHCLDHGATVETSGVYVDGAFDEVEVVVRDHCTLEWASYEREWILGFGNESGLVAPERTLRGVIVYPDGSEHHYERSMEARVVDEGGPHELDFRGQSDHAFWAPRDQSLRYGTGDLFPPDPEPHALFDIREAGTYALGIDSEEVRVFLSRAEEPHLKSAALSTGARSFVYWYFVFADEHGNSLMIHLNGIKVPGGPLIVTNERVDAYDEPHWPGSSYEGEVAYVGDLARRSDAYHEAQDRTPQRYHWFVPWLGGPPQYGSQASGSGLLPTTDHSESVTLDATTGIVIGHSVSRSSLGL